MRAYVKTITITINPSLEATNQHLLNTKKGSQLITTTISYLITIMPITNLHAVRS